MPLPILFIGVAAATGAFGAGKTIKAGVDSSTAKKINKNANEIVDEATNYLNEQRLACGRSLSQLGEEKLFILNTNMTASAWVGLRIPMPMSSEAATETMGCT